MPTHRPTEEMYVKISPGSRMTLKMDVVVPMNPD
jgi:hypothetical protein